VGKKWKKSRYKKYSFIKCNIIFFINIFKRKGRFHFMQTPVKENRLIPLTEAQVSQYERDGYLVVKGL